MTALLDCLKALAARPAPLPEPLAFIAHPAWVEDESMLAVLRGMQTNGIDVRVQTDIRLPSVSLDYWLDRKARPSPDDVILWPDDSWCYRHELAEFNHKSDDYEVLAVGASAYAVHQAREARRS